jgi:uncharacterized protein (TIGR00369 family)
MDRSPAPKFGVPAPEDIAGLTGREILQAMLEGRLPGPMMAQTMGFKLVEVGDGFVVFEAKPGPHVMNPTGAVHGGWALALIDSVTGCAGHSTLPAGVGYASIETKVNFTRPIAPDAGTVRAEGRVVGRGRTIISAEGNIVDSRGRLLAHGTSTLMMLRPERGERRTRREAST